MCTILCVDDDKNVLKMLKRVLRGEDRTILTAGFGKEGLSILEVNQVQLVISDFIMPEMNGMEFLKIVHSKYPRTVCFMITGTPGTQSAVEASSPDVVHTYFKKPIEVPELKLAVELALEEWESASKES